MVTSGMPYSFEMRLRDGTVIQCDGLTRQGVIQESKALTGIQKRWMSRVESIEEANPGSSIPDLVDHVMGRDPGAIRGASRGFEAGLEGEFERLTEQLRHHSRAVTEYGLPDAEWRVTSEEFAERLRRILTQQEITNVRIIGPE